MYQPSVLSLILFAAGWALAIYLLNCAIAGQLKRIDVRQVVLYFTTLALIGLYGEIFLDSMYKQAVGHPLWYYNILPIQGGYTSSYAIVTWGLYGFHLYLLHGSLEALLLEALLTISARLAFGKYLYYYLPGDLWHVSSFQNIPFYFICGVVVLKSLKRFRTDLLFFSLMSSFLVLVLVFLTS